MTRQNSRKRSRILLGAATLALMLASLLTLSAAPADAWTHTGCKYSGSNPSIDYSFENVTSRNRTAINTAQARWDATASPGFFREDTWWTDSNIDIFDANYASTAWAWVTYGCGSNSIYHSNEVDLSINHTTTASLSTNELAIVMVHELGHAYGLGHSSFTCSSPGPAVMRQGTGKFGCSGTAPWNNDVLGVQARY